MQKLQTVHATQNLENKAEQVQTESKNLSKLLNLINSTDFKIVVIAAAVVIVTIVLLNPELAFSADVNGYEQIKTASGDLTNLFKGTGMNLVNAIGLVSFAWTGIIQKSVGGMAVIGSALAAGNLLVSYM